MGIASSGQAPGRSLYCVVYDDPRGQERVSDCVCAGEAAGSACTCALFKSVGNKCIKSLLRALRVLFSTAPWTLLGMDAKGACHRWH